MEWTLAAQGPYLAPTMFSDDITTAARALLDACRSHRLMIATAESCTGGLIAGALTAVPGSSDVFERGFVTYSNQAKSEMLGVPSFLIAAKGAVSEEVACAMAEGALVRSSTDLAVAVTGVAGPDGGSDDKPVGLVHIAAAQRGRETLHQAHRFGDIGRDEVRQATVRAALALLAQAVG